MTRNLRLENEEWVVELLLKYLTDREEGWVVDKDIHDKPDLVLVSESGYRVGCEITRLGPEKLYKLLANNYVPENGELFELDVTQKIEKWVGHTIQKKNVKIREYMKNTKAQEIWLVISGVTDRPKNKNYKFYDLVDLDPLMHQIPNIVNAVSNTKHGFQRIFLASAIADKVFCAYPYDHYGEESSSSIMNQNRDRKIILTGTNTLSAGNGEVSLTKPITRRDKI